MLTYILMLLLLFGTAFNSLEASAAVETSAAAPGWNMPQVGFVVDTTASMGPELNALAAAWQAQAQQGPLSGNYHLVGFKDSAMYLGQTESPGTFYNWLSALEASGGGKCPDHALAGLLNMARNMPQSLTPASEILLVTDAAPLGKRTTYAHLANRLLKRGVQVHTLSNGWCPDHPITENALVFLTMASGGEFLLTDGPNYYTDTLIVLNKIDATDRLGIFQGTVSPGNPLSFDLEVDGTMTTLGVEDDDYPVWCLTCTRRIPGLSAFGFAAPEGTFTVELRDPKGNLVGTGTDGYEELSSAYRRFQRLSTTSGLITGTWKVEVRGNGSFWIDYYADSTLHLLYAGRHTRQAGKPVPFQATLVNEVGNPSLVKSASFSLISMDGRQEQPIELFDDGQHGDGATGDGVYGGMVQRDHEGCWMLMVRGTLQDGSSFSRMYPAPIRFRGFSLDDPAPSSAVPGTPQTINFTLVNGETTRAAKATTFDLEVFSDQGWAITNTVPLSVTLQPGERFNIEVPIQVPENTSVGTTDNVVLVSAPTTDIGMATSATAELEVVDSFKVFLPVVLRD
jgi:hypothetical protein